MPTQLRTGGRSRYTRRSLLKFGGLGGLLAASGACAHPQEGASPAAPVEGACAAADLSATDRRLIVSNWEGYIDPGSSGARSTRKGFQDVTGITVRYSADINDNASFYDEVSNRLAACEPVDRDLVVLTDWMAARLIGLGWMRPLDANNVMNLHTNLIDSLRDKAWDPKLGYHAPWQSGLTGIAYNAALVPEVRSFEELLTRQDLHGRVTLLSEMRDTMGFFLKLTGADPGSFTDDQWANALDRVGRVKRSGQVRAFPGNDYVDGLASGDIAACEAWSGDIMSLQADHPDIRFVAPEEGLALWSDNMLVPNLAAHQANAERWIDYYYEPEVAARLAAWVNFICPVEGAREAMVKVDATLVDNPLIFPDDELLASTFDFMPLTEFQDTQYAGDWLAAIAG